MTAPRRQRSEYLKNGCKECKRRKIKCDEFINPPPEAIRKINKQGRVACWQCTRLHKECEYPMKGEKVPRVSRKALMEQKRREAEAASGSASAAGTSLHNGGVSLDGTLNNGALSNNGLSNSGGATNGYHGAGYGLNTPSNGINGILGYGFGVGLGLSLTLGLGLGYFQGPMSYSVLNLLNGLNPYAGPNFPVSAASSISNPLVGGVGPPALPRPQAAPLAGNLSTPTSSSHFSSASTSQFPPAGLLEPSLATASSTAEPPEDENVKLDPISFYDQLDLTLLAADLNNLVLDMIYDVNFDVKGLTDSESQQPTPPTPNSEDFESNYYDHIPRNLSLGYIGVKRASEKTYLHEFYREFANIILPFNAYDAHTRQFFNPARDILLKCAHREPFLLAAILAQGARSVFTKSANPDDEQAYYSYLLRCLKLLGPALGDAGEKNGLALVANIEAVLLTVLLLTSSNAVNARQNWRPHLRGAKDLLLKHNKNRPLTKKSKVLIFCKYWFVSFEILAGLGSKNGGTVHVDEELDLLLNYADPYEVQVLTELGLILPNGFNLIGGYHNDCVPHLRDLIKLLNKSRAAKAQASENGKTTQLQDANPGSSSKKKFISACQSTECIRLLGEFERARNKVFFSQNPVMSPDDFPNGVIPQNHLLDSATVAGTRKIVSWADISQQLYCFAAVITILTDFLGVPHDSAPVQELTKGLLDLISFVEPPNNEPVLFKYSVLMVQWPALVAGLNAIEPEHVAAVERFFNVAAETGSGSAGHSLKMIKRHWKRRELGLDESEEEVDVVNY